MINKGNNLRVFKDRYSHDVNTNMHPDQSFIPNLPKD